MTNNQQLAVHCRDVIANPQDHLDWVVDMARVALKALKPIDLSACKKLWYEHDDLSHEIVCIPVKEIKKVIRTAGLRCKS